MIKKEEERQILFKREEDLKEKQKFKNSYQGKIQTIDKQYQHKYLLILREMEETNKNSKKYEEEIEKADKNLGASRKDLEIWEEKIKNKPPKSVVMLKDMKA